MQPHTSRQYDALKPFEPEIGETVIVQCNGYRTLGYRTTDNQWRAAFGNYEMTDVVRVVPLTQKFISLDE